LSGADALFARAIALEDAGRPEEALAQYRELLTLAPAHADARHNHGLLLARVGRLAEAEHSHREYVERHPEDPRAYSDLADVLVAFRRDAEALAALDAALAIRANDVAALVRRGAVLACLQRFEEARSVFAAATARYPHQVESIVRQIAPGGAIDTALSPQNIFLTRRFWAQKACDWTDWEGYVAQAKAVAGAPSLALEPAIGFMVLHLPLTDAERHGVVRHVAAPIEAQAPVLPAPGPRRRPRIRVGVLSPDYYEHLNAHLLRPLFELADRARFELYAYSLGADDGSLARARIRAAADCFRDLRSLSDQDAAQAIRGDDVDILLDVGGYTADARFGITARRPARVQASYLAYPASLGSPRVDYAIVDRVVAPRQDDWTEKLLYLPHTFVLYDYRTTPVETVSRREYGLPEDALVFCASHKAEKITPECFYIWMDVLRRVPRSVLWLLQLPMAAENLRRHAAGCGVDPGRLIFAPVEPRDRYLARLRLADLMLDAYNHSALTTACDSLGVGLPLLAFGGRTACAARAAESFVRAAGVPELVMADRVQYVETAVRLASDRAALHHLRDRLAQNRTTASLFDTAGRVRELERVFEQML
jgi:predicted O-linked N-acetylglucosamine transferase (SPINDLY family)